MNKKKKVFVQENVFENVCKMAVILCRPQCAKSSICGDASVNNNADHRDAEYDDELGKCSS